MNKYKVWLIILIILEVLVLAFSIYVLKYQFDWFGGSHIEPWFNGPVHAMSNLL